MAALCACFQMGTYYLASAESFDFIDDDGNFKSVSLRTELPSKYTFTNEAGDIKKYDSQEVFQFERGRIVAYGGTAGVCTSVFLIPGIQIMPLGVVAVAYFLALSYLFLGISIVAEVFMSGIEEITKQTVKVDIKD
jgi:hypothetical protein